MLDMIRLDDVTVRFGSLAALDHFSLTVIAGEIVALIGPNGAGKSTALRVATGQIAPTSGSATIGGVAPNCARSQFGVVPDKDNHFDEFTARRNLQFFAALYNVPSERVDESLRLLDLQAASDRPVREFSLGMRRRLLLARAFLHRPKVLLLDEPLANLDEPGLAAVTGILQQARANGAAVLLTSHQANQIPFLDRFVVIERGRIVITSPTAGDNMP
jgi:ABC-2 type transport system ATP-binding protein